MCTKSITFTSLSESIVWFIEGQPFSRSYDWLLAHPLPPSPVSKLDRRHIGNLRKRDNLLTGGGGGGWARSRIIRTPQSLVICKSFKTLNFLQRSVVKRPGSTFETPMDWHLHSTVQVQYDPLLPQHPSSPLAKNSTTVLHSKHYTHLFFYYRSRHFLSKF